ncbi:MAG: DUF3732 domain-containing protein [Christensenellaceae bacterium]
MQIKKIILYGQNGKIRILPFSLGRVNIVSGKSKTGKSVIGDIIDYCFGGDSCNIAVGVVRNTVEWYGLLLEHKGENIFIARQNPPNGQASTTKCCYQFGVTDAPININSAAPIDHKGLERLLSNKIGISENLFNPPEGRTRQALSANIRHSMFYCIQGQDEIAAQKTLFHKQSEDYITQSIKDTLPYFLGVVNEENLELTAERTSLRREAVLIQRSIDEVTQLQGNGLQRATALLVEAKEVGLLPENLSVVLSDYKEVRISLAEACRWNPVEIEIAGMDRISYLQSQVRQDEIQLENIGIDLRSATEFLEDTKGYTTEISHQRGRLESIGLFESIDFDPTHCPFCSAKLNEPSVGAADIHSAINKLSNSLSTATKEKPQLNEYIGNLVQQQLQIRERIATAKLEIEAIYRENKEAIALKDLNSRRARIVGRISLWLESVVITDDITTAKDKLYTIHSRIAEIDALLSDDAIEERKQSAINIISAEMTTWAKELQLEHSDYPYRLDLSKITVVVDRDRPVPLQQLGSGSNWLGCHLIALFALHKFFIANKRPVPNFLFIDQPSQVYFPPETNDENVDSQEIRAIYKFIFDRAKELAPNMQVIIVDHADIQENWFQESITEKWWADGDALIPKDWL